MGCRVASILQAFHYFEGDGTGTGLHGGNLTITQGLRTFAARPEVEAMEIFVDPAILSNPARLKEAADLILPEWRKGRGFLSFLDIHSIPEVWADGRERILWSVDVRFAARDRMIRDAWASGPTPICWDTHSLGSYHFYSEMAPAAHFEPVSFDRVMAISHAVAEGLDLLFSRRLRPDLPGFIAPQEVVTHHVDTARFEPPDPARKALLRRTFGLPEEGVIALFLGRLTASVKADLMPLLESFRDARQKDGLLLIVGPENAPGYAAALQARAVELGIEGSVMIRGAVEPSLRHLVFAACDLFVFPGDSTVEALGNTVMEAMATGLPSLISDWNGIRDLVEEGVTGFKAPCLWMGGLDRVDQFSCTADFVTDYLFQAQMIHIDMTVFTARLRDLLKDQALRERLGAEARRRALENHAKEPVLKRLFAMWEEQLAEARREPPEAKAARKRRAMESILLRRSGDYLAHYATRSVREDDPVEITDKGRAVRQGKARLSLYDDTLPMVSGPAMELILQAAGMGGATVGSLCEAVCSRFGCSRDTAVMQIGLLLKQQALSLQVK